MANERTYTQEEVDIMIARNRAKLHDGDEIIKRLREQVLDKAIMYNEKEYRYNDIDRLENRIVDLQMGKKSNPLDDMPQTIIVHGKALGVRHIEDLYERIDSEKATITILNKNLEGERARAARPDPHLIRAEAKAQCLEDVVENFVTKLCLIPTFASDE